jgi:hypothetical protein
VSFHEQRRLLSESEFWNEAHTALCGSASIANVTSQDEATWAGEGSYLEVAAMHDAHFFYIFNKTLLLLRVNMNNKMTLSRWH